MLSQGTADLQPDPQQKSASEPSRHLAFCIRCPGSAQRRSAHSSAWWQAINPPQAPGGSALEPPAYDFAKTVREPRCCSNAGVTRQCDDYRVRPDDLQNWISIHEVMTLLAVIPLPVAGAFTDVRRESATADLLAHACSWI